MANLSNLKKFYNELYRHTADNSDWKKVSARLEDSKADKKYWRKLLKILATFTIKPQTGPVLDTLSDEIRRLTLMIKGILSCNTPNDNVHYHEACELRDTIAARTRSGIEYLEYMRTTAEKSSGEKAGKIKTTAKRFSFNDAQAFFDGKDLQLPTGAELVPVKILKKLHEFFGTIVPFKTLDENSTNTASDFLRGKIRTILLAFKKHKVPCKIQSKRWTGYILSNSKTHS